jgi:RHS repeat-associated protein
MDGDGQIITHEEYSPFGSQTYFESWTKSRKRYGYSGKERDKETSLLYFGKRYYIPWLCRWLNPDPLGTADGLNVYQYVHNNPINLHDPEGTSVSLIRKRLKKRDKLEKGHSKKLKREKQERSEGKAEARGLIIESVKNWKKYVSDPNTIEEYAPTRSQEKRVSRRKIDKKLADGASFIRSYDPDAIHKSHLIPHQFKGPLANLIDVDSWCVMVPGWINTGPMASALDQPWRRFFAAPVSNKPNAMTTLEYFTYIGMRGNKERRQGARNILLSKCRKLVESTFFTWDTVLEYRVHLAEKNIGPEYNIKPQSWSHVTGSPYILPGPRRTTEEDFFIYGTFIDPPKVQIQTT